MKDKQVRMYLETLYFALFWILIFQSERVNYQQTLQNCPYKGFKDVFRLDRQISTMLRGLTTLFSNQHHEKIKGWQMKLSGSLVEGDFSPRYFSVEKKKFEADIETHFLRISHKYQHCIEAVPYKIGFLKINMKKNGCHQMTYEKNMKPFRSLEMNKEIENLTLNEDGYVLTYEAKKKLLYDRYSLVEDGPGDLKNSIEGMRTAFALLLNVPLSKVNITNSYRNITKATCEAGFDLVYDKQKISLSADFSTIFKIVWKPKIIIDWENRQRKWPKNVQEIFKTDEGYIIAKPSTNERHNTKTIEFRYSFAHVERKLISMQSATQRIVYLIFKSIFYRLIIPINKDKISSFFGKNIMMKLCEEKPP
eukprot:TCONS_00003626-protein